MTSLEFTKKNSVQEFRRFNLCSFSSAASTRESRVSIDLRVLWEVKWGISLKGGDAIELSHKTVQVGYQSLVEEQEANTAFTVFLSMPANGGRLYGCHPFGYTGILVSPCHKQRTQDSPGEDRYQHPQP